MSYYAQTNVAANQGTSPAVEGYGQPAAGGAYVVPPPAGYPSKDGQDHSATQAAHNQSTISSSRGDGFWKGW